MTRFIHSLLALFLFLICTQVGTLYAQTVSININSVSVGMYSGSGSDCGDCISAPDPYVGVRFKHSATGTWGGVGQSNRDDVGCNSYGGVGGYSTSSIPWSGTTINVEIQGLESDGAVCASDDGNCGLGAPSSGTNNLLIVAQPSCGTNNGQYSSNRENCASDGSTNDYRANWYYQWWWDAASINAATTAGVIGGNGTVCSGAAITVTNGTNGSLYPRGSVVMQQNFNGGGWTNVTAVTTNTASTASAISLTYSATLTTPGTYQYRRLVTYCTNSAGGTTSYASNTVTITVVPDPAITTQPVSPTAVCVGGTIPALSIAASGGTPSLTYQWYSNTANNNTSGTPIGGATGTTYTPPNGTAGTLYYYAIVSAAGTACNPVTSAVATVQVVAQPTLSAPASSTLCQGGSVNITSNRSGGTGTFNLEWQYSADGSTGWAAVVDGVPSGISYSGETTGTLTISGNGSEPIAAKYYRLVATSTNPAINCSAISATSTITTVADPVLSVPVNPTICVGGSATITSTSTGGTGSLSRQWEYSADGSTGWASVVNGTPAGITYSGANTQSLVITGDGSESVGLKYYRLRIFTTSGTVGCETYSSVSTVTTVAEPTLSAPTALTTVCAGGTASFSSTASGGTGAFTYRWQYSADGSTGWANVANGTPAGITYTGATGTTLTVTGNGTEATGDKYYRLVLSSTTAAVGCDAISATAVVSTVADPVLTAPTPATQTVCQNGSPASISTSASGGTGSAYSYQWYVNSSNSTSGGTALGTGSSISSPTATIGTRYYYAVVTQPESGCSGTTPATAEVVVVALPSSGGLTKTPNVATVCEGASVSATATAGANGTGTITDVLQFRTNSGAGFSAWNTYTSGAAIATTGLTAVEIQTFRTATGSGCTTSTPTVVSWTVVPQPQAGTLAKTPNTTHVCIGDNVSATLTAGTGGTGTVTDVLQYRFNGTGGWTSYTSGSNLSTTGRTLVEIRTYRTATGTNCTTSDTNFVSWIVSPLPSATPNLDFLSTCDNSARISASSISSGATVSWNRTSGTGTPATSTDNPLTVNGLTQGATTVYNLLVSNAGCSNISAGSVNIVVPTNNASNIASTNSCGYCVVTDGNVRSFYNNAGEIIARIEDDPLVSPAQLNLTEVCVGLDGSVQTILDNLGNQQPYLPRKWSISPAANTSARVTLYFTNAELLALQSAASSTVYQFSGYDLWVSKYAGGGNGSFTPPCTGGAPGCGQVTAVNVPASFSAYGSNHRVEFVVSSFSTFYVHPALFPSAPLPVELLSFTGWNQGSVNRLQWKTASEQNTEVFEVQKSSDGVNWTTIGERAAAGNSTQPLTYDFTDNLPVLGNNYYRLKIIDFDGTFNFSNIINIQLNDVVQNNFTGIYPNPTGGQLNVDIQSTALTNTVVRAFDVLGKVIFSQDATLVKGMNTLRLDFSHLASGTYILQFVDVEGKSHTAKFVKD